MSGAGRLAGAVVLAVGLLLSGAAVASGPAATLDPALVHALSEAYLGNPQLATERQLLRETDEGVPRALSGWRPTVRIEGDAGGSAVSDSIDTAHDPERRLPQQGTLSLSQPLYTGGRVAAQVAQSEALVRAQRAALRASEATVLLAAATAYLDVARDQAIVALNHGQGRVLERSLAATMQAYAAGAVTETDIAQARARLADQRAAIARVEGQLAVSRSVFVQQVGEPPGSLFVPDLRPDLGLDLRLDLELGLADGQDRVLREVESGNPDLAQARLALAASEKGVDIARAGLLPKLSLVFEAERFKETDVQQQHQRDNIAEGLLQFSVPLYQGGAVSADTRQAKEAAARASLQIQTVLRAARQQAVGAMETLSAAVTRVGQEKVSIEANRIAERGIARQQSVGARTVLEVLNAQQELLSAQVGLVSAERDQAVAGLQLLASIGRMNAVDLGLPVPIFDPEDHYKATRNRWYGTDVQR